MSNYNSIDSSNYRWDGNPFIMGGRTLSGEQFDLLVELSSIHSQKVILAMHDHLVLEIRVRLSVKDMELMLVI